MVAVGRISALVPALAGAAVVLSLAAFSGSALAQDKDLGTFRDWNAQSYVEAGAKVCNIWSKPKKEEGKYTRRGEVFAFVTHRPSENRRNEISFQVGYTFKKDSELRIAIGGKNFVLFTEGESAWTATTEEDDQLVRSMKAGNSMIVRGVSSRGTQTKDTYSLFGFTAALNAINQACRP